MADGHDILNSAKVSDEEALKRADEFRAAISTRRTVRDYDPAPVPQEVIEACITAAGTAPSGANQQPWHFVAVRDPETKQKIRAAAEAEERRFYEGGAGQDWLDALAPIGTDADKPHLEDAAWLIVVFAQRWGTKEDGSKQKHYYVPESVGIATGMLLTALHMSGLVTLTHTPNPMGFLRDLLGRPDNEKATMIIAAGHPAQDATVPKMAKIKKPLADILTIR
ncbi:nitroreductase family protein [uncultured Tateyamaria sp.]|uniref:nitroreductase family protein n=1 Tax=Tateyamaria sp. 1078 TaxID=3417464 RepID=UPI002636E772|nr:nitroreductase family protein [uncultured Tateyamaria sp.]